MSKTPTKPKLHGVRLLTSPGVTEGSVWGIPKVRAILVRRTAVDLQVDKSAHRDPRDDVGRVRVPAPGCDSEDRPRGRIA
jgi:hypothetical protein